MKKAIVLAMLLSIVSVIASAQQAQMNHVHPKIKVTDGAVNPELIPDSTAYHLYFLNLSTKVNPSVDESHYQSAAIGHLGLDGIDQLRLIGVLRDFRDRRDGLIARFNIYATSAQARGEVVDQTLFLQQLDDLTVSTRASLKLSLSDMALTNLDRRVQEVKKHIKHFESEVQQ